MKSKFLLIIVYTLFALIVGSEVKETTVIGDSEKTDYKILINTKIKNRKYIVYVMGRIPYILQDLVIPRGIY